VDARAAKAAAVSRKMLSQYRFPIESDMGNAAHATVDPLRLTLPMKKMPPNLLP